MESFLISVLASIVAACIFGAIGLYIRRALKRRSERAKESAAASKADDITPQDEKRIHGTFLFTDLVKSTDIRDACIREYGDRGNYLYERDVISPHDVILKSQTEKFRGTLRKTIEGDACIIVFSYARDAVECAVAIQRAFIQEQIRVPVTAPNLPPTVQVRIGIHTGAARELDRAGQLDYSDHTLNIASRIKDLANGGQVLMSDETWHQVGAIRALAGHTWADYSLKGVSGTRTLIEALWDDRSPRPPGVPLHDLAFDTFAGRAIILDSARLAKAADDARVRGFYEGTPLDWDIISAHADIQRDQQDGALKELRNAAEQMRLICVLGEPGAGKSTFAWRLAAELVREEKDPVLFVKDGQEPEVWYRLERFAGKLDRHFYVLVDDIFSEPDAEQAFRRLSPWLPITVLATSRLNEYRARGLKCKVTPLAIEPPSEREKGDLLRKLGKDFDTLSPMEQARLKRTDQFWVLMMELTAGEDHRKIISSTIERLRRMDEECFRSYEYLCFAYQFHLAIPVSLLDRLGERGRYLNLPDRESAQGLVFWDVREGCIRVRHPAIAKVAAEIYAESRPPHVVFESIIEAVDLESRIHRRFLVALLRRLTKAQPSLVTEFQLAKHSHIDRIAEQADTVGELNAWSHLNRLWRRAEKAETCIDLALLKQPESEYECHTLLGMWRSRRLEQNALPAISHFLEKKPDQAKVRATHLALLRKYGSDDEVQTAIRDISKWIIHHGDDAEVRSAWLSFVGTRGSEDQRKSVYEETRKWLGIHPEAKQVWASLIAWLLKEEKLKDATGVAEEAVRHHPVDQSIQEQWLRILEQGDEEESVRECYEAFVRKFPGHLSAQLGFAKWLMKRDYDEEAEEIMRDLSVANPTWFQVHHRYGELLLKKGRFEEALRELEYALVFEPGHQLAHNEKAHALRGLGRIPEAEREFKQAIYFAKKRKEPHGKFYADQGWFFLETGRPWKALTSFEGACQEEPDKCMNHYGMARALFELREYPRAAEEFRRILETEGALQPEQIEDVKEKLAQCLAIGNDD